MSDALSRGESGDSVDFDEWPPITVYTASKSKYGPMWRDFRSAWSDLNITVSSTWIDESGEGETEDFTDLWRRCIDEVRAADLLVAFHQPDEVWKGAFIEIGAALALGKPVYVVGRPPGSWVEHSLVSFAADPDDALDDFIRVRQATTYKDRSQGS